MGLMAWRSMVISITVRVERRDCCKIWSQGVTGNVERAECHVASRRRTRANEFPRRLTLEEPFRSVCCALSSRIVLMIDSIEGLVQNIELARFSAS